jgi:transcriptional regulator with XRE-family HTH domain
MQRHLIVQTPKPPKPPKPASGKTSRRKDIDAIIGAKVRALRMRKGLSQEKLGDMLGITFQQVQKYEKGANSIATCRIPAVCEALGVTPSDLFDGITVNSPASEDAPKVSPPVISALAWKVALATDRLSPPFRTVVMNVIKALNRDPAE